MRWLIILILFFCVASTCYLVLRETADNEFEVTSSRPIKVPIRDLRSLLRFRAIQQEIMTPEPDEVIIEPIEDNSYAWQLVPAQFSAIVAFLFLLRTLNRVYFRYLTHPHSS